jgi:hypothetical protein
VINNYYPHNGKFTWCIEFRHQHLIQCKPHIPGHLSTLPVVHVYTTYDLMWQQRASNRILLGYLGRHTLYWLCNRSNSMSCFQCCNWVDTQYKHTIVQRQSAMQIIHTCNDFPNIIDGFTDWLPAVTNLHSNNILCCWFSSILLSSPCNSKLKSEFHQ